MHNNTGHIHIHVLVSYTTIDGKQKGMGGNDLNDLKCFISHIAEAEGCCKVRMYNNTGQKHTGSITDCDTDDPEFEIPDTEYLSDPQEIFGDITYDPASEIRNEPSGRQVINKFYTTNNYYNFCAPTTFNQAGRYGYGNYNRDNQQYPALTGSTGNVAAMGCVPAGSVPFPPAVPSAPALPEVTAEDAQYTEAIITWNSDIVPNNNTVEYRVDVTCNGAHLDTAPAFSSVEDANAYAAQFNNIERCTAGVYTVKDGRVNPFVIFNP